VEWIDNLGSGLAEGVGAGGDHVLAARTDSEARLIKAREFLGSARLCGEKALASPVLATSFVPNTRHAAWTELIFRKKFNGHRQHGVCNLDRAPAGDSGFIQPIHHYVSATRREDIRTVTHPEWNEDASAASWRKRPWRRFSSSD
jgi:hypothetical protein